MNTENKSATVRVVAAVVDTRQLTLYKEDGETIIIPQGDMRLRRIVEEATPQLIRQGWADVVIDEAGDNSYAKFEQEGSGAVKFFRIAKAKLKDLFTPVKPDVIIDPSPVPPLSIGPVPVSAAPTALPAVQLATPAPIEPTLEDARQDLVNVVAAVAIGKIPMDDLKGTVVVSATPAQDFINTAGIYDVSEEDEVAAAGEAAAAPAQAQSVVMSTQDDDEEEQDSDDEPQSPKGEQTMAAIDDIMKHAVPVAAADFHERDIAQQGRIVEKTGHTIKDHGEGEETHTIIAVVEGANGPKVIPGMEKIKTQFGRAAKMGSTVGVENFLRRIAAVIEQRSHSVEDLLKFMERADLPIADDGSILIYKVLNMRNDKANPPRFVDCHTGKVEQFVGAMVCMDVKLVDHNRNNECSNGLHVARRGYIRSFSGNVCVLAKLAPEDVIAVPSYDANKMRVCGYHIIAQLTQEQYNLVKANSPITSIESGKQLLAKAMAGDHIRKTHEVRITQQKGGGVVETALKREDAVKLPIVPVVSPAPEAPKPVEVEALVNPEAEALDQPTDPLDVVKVVEKEQGLSKKEQAAILFKAFELGEPGALDKLLAFKKAAKKGWDVLGIPDPTTVKTPTAKQIGKVKGKGSLRSSKKKLKQAVKQLKAELAPKPTTPSLFPKPEGKVNEATVANKDFIKVVKAVKAEPAPASRIVNDVELGLGSYRERVQKLMAIGLTSAGIAGAVFKLKQQSKKSWEILGVTPEQVEQIMKLKGEL